MVGRFTLCTLLAAGCFGQSTTGGGNNVNGPGNGGGAAASNAANVTYSSQVPRTVAAKFSDTPSIKDYGATGLGPGHDDTTSITKAIAAIPSSGGDLYCPPGNYEVSSTILITTSNFTWHGSRGGVTSAGALNNACNLYWNGPINTPVIKIQGTYNTTIDGINIQGNNIAGGTGILVFSNNVPPTQRTTIRNIGIVDMGVTGTDGICIDYEGSTQTQQVDGNLLENFNLNSCYIGIKINSNNYSYSSINQGGLAYNTFGIDMVRAGPMTVKNISLGPLIDNGQGNAPTDCSVAVSTTIPAFFLIEGQHDTMSFENVQGESATVKGYMFRVLNAGAGNSGEPITISSSVLNLASSFDGLSNLDLVGNTLSTAGLPLANVCKNNSGQITEAQTNYFNSGSGGLPSIITSTGNQNPLTLTPANSGAFITFKNGLAIPLMNLTCTAGSTVCNNLALQFSNPDAPSAQSYQIISGGTSSVVGSGGFGVYDGITGNIPLKIDAGALNNGVHITSTGLNNVASCHKYTLSNNGTNFTVALDGGTPAASTAIGASSSQNVNILALGQFQIVAGISVKSATAWSWSNGGTFTTTVGDASGTSTSYIVTPYDMGVTVANTNFMTGSGFKQLSTGTSQLIARVTASSGNALNSATITGSTDYRICTANIP